MISKRTAAVGAALLIIMVSFISSFATLQIVDYINVKNGDKVIITKKQYEQLKDAQKLETVKSIIQKNYIKEVEDETLIDGAIRGLVASLNDPYSVYYTKEEFKEFQEHTRGTYAGVGLMVTVDPRDKMITVIQAFEDGPSAEAGIKPGDKIVKVNDVELDGTMLDKAVALMKGPKGTKVKVTVYRDGSFKEYELVRDIITIDTVDERMLAGKIGYIRIASFDENTADAFKDAIEKLEKEGMEGLIIDVRDNPGGLLNAVTEVADVLLPEGKIVYTEDRYGKQEMEMSDAKALGLPLVILVNGSSASASEILAGSVQDHGVGKIVGTQTFGKGVVQSIRVFKDASGLKLTTSSYFTPKGRSIHEVGITPDVVVDFPEEFKKNPEPLTDENDVQLRKAIEVVKELMEK
ncbi:MAG: S41 family peptidase [Clostridia bacterium]|jgi:carboxyl-terminal processing protease